VSVRRRHACVASDPLPAVSRRLGHTDVPIAERTKNIYATVEAMKKAVSVAEIIDAKSASPEQRR
jgi:integrase